jgi:2-polyprenyl-6-methoxyphenol hydroxylase-like FAD-dependent oxidoreductase
MITIIGAGMGGLTLASVLHRNGIPTVVYDIESAFAAHEAAMFPRAAEKAAESAANLELVFQANSPQGILKLFASHNVATD